ncbi:efflux RND transporter periplasmic adaptor subunit [Mesorhizobium sp. M1050]|uniref:efflux RND transporter periplasmic adaptor subunit n=1 Tax=Mesorhizobium sp. M1050 TaxID=2957051 RepID=UPI00333BA03B
MPRIRFHKLAAIVVLIGFAAWMATGEFSSVGSVAANNAKAAGVEQAKAPDANKPKAAEAEPKAPLRTVAVVTPPRKTYARAIRVSGLTEADKRAVLAPRGAGVIDRLPVKQGQHVKTGDLVMMLAAEEKISMVDNAKQLVVQRQAELEASLQLMKSGNLPKLQLDTARSNLTLAQSQLDTAQAELDRNEVKAPFDGVIDRVPVELGSSIMQGGEVATILKLDPVIARGEVSERDLGYLKLGDKANIRLVSGQTVEGTVRYISRDASSATRTFRVEVAIPNGDGSVPAGMTAEIALNAQPTDAVLLPRSVVTLGDKGDLGIRAVAKDNKVAFFPIDLVDDTPTGLVLGGIPADARIIVAGQELVKEGDLVNPVEADQATIKKLLGEATAGTQ